MAAGNLEEIELPLDLTDTEEENQGEVKSDTQLVWAQEVTNLRTSVYKVLIIHGLWNGSKDERASLIVLRFKLTSKDTGKRRRWHKAFRVRLILRRIPSGGAHQDPYIEDYEPAKQTCHLSVSKVKTSTHTGYQFKLEPKISAEGIGVEGIGFNKDKSTDQEFQRLYLYTIESDLEMTDGEYDNRLGPDGVFWNSRQNDDEDVGVGDILQVAVLVRRPDEEKFSIKVIPKVGVDGEYESARQWHRVKSCFRKGSGTILEYNPKKDVVPKLPDGIDPKNLCKLERSQILEQLAFVHQPEELLPRRFRERHP